jgi:hypothetical protein
LGFWFSFGIVQLTIRVVDVRAPLHVCNVPLSGEPASEPVQQLFPHVRAGTGRQPTSGGGFVAGDRYVARSAAVAWSRKTNDLTLYLLWRKSVSCATLRQVITMPGHLVQVHVTDKPHVPVRKQVGNPQVAFLTIFRNPKVPTRIAGLRQGPGSRSPASTAIPEGYGTATSQCPRRYTATASCTGTAARSPRSGASFGEPPIDLRRPLIDTQSVH